MNKTLVSMIALLIFLDRTSKYLVERFIPLEDSVNVVPGFFSVTHLQNPGGAFNFFAESTSAWREPLLIFFPAAALVIISVLLWKNRETQVKTTAYALIFAGAAGNLIDRLAKGTVTDFLDFYAGTHHWFPFNLADSAIVIGAVLLAWWMLRPAAGRASKI